MKHKLIFFAILFFAPSFVFASTSVSGTLASDATWTSANSPYIISAFGFSVPSGVTLTVGPGVVVKSSQSNTSITINGNLNVQGSETDPAYFTSFNDTIGGDTGNSAYGETWAGMTVNSGASVHIDHANLRRASTGISNNGGTVTVSNSTFENDTYGILQGSGSVSITASTFQNNQTGISSSGTGSVSFTGNVFSNNSTLADFDLSSGLTFSNSNNTANGTGRQGIFLYANGENIANQTLSADSIAYVVKVFGVNIPAGKTFIVKPGAIMKFEQSNASLTVNGTLDMKGAEGNLIRVTSITDDSIGGDTDGIPNAPDNYNYSNWGILFQ